jgi:hypothetical protein
MGKTPYRLVISYYIQILLHPSSGYSDGNIKYGCKNIVRNFGNELQITMTSRPRIINQYDVIFQNYQSI